MEITALVAELRKCALEGLQDGEKEKINSEPHGVTFIVTFLTAATLLNMALRVNNSEQMGFLAVGRGCSFHIHYSIDKHNAKAHEEHKTGWLITTCLLPITPITLEATGPMNVQHGAN